MNVAGLVANFGAAVLILYEWRIFQTEMDDSCDFLIPYTVCFLIRSPLFCGALNMHTFGTIFFIERLVATVKSRYYEKSKGNVIAIALIIVQWSFALILLAYHGNGQVGKGLRVPICKLTTVNTDYLFLTFFLLLFYSFFSFTTRILSENQPTVSAHYPNAIKPERSKIRENVRFLRLAIHVLLTNGVVSLIHTVLSVLFKKFHSPDFEMIQRKLEPLSQSVLGAIVVMLIEIESRRKKRITLDTSLKGYAIDGMTALKDTWNLNADKRNKPFIQRLLSLCWSDE
ncbi:unnamed protein product [Thelazia callipaeda]|uniref:G_PROTEIN_RECEP_F1_2 domain-containing protein n=1 Tax=Thelazia callipaeda TaxID=103827 RepID=A0A0N5CND0_THECL|nr:unnamed protein product [Thelazia callipaeda]